MIDKIIYKFCEILDVFSNFLEKLFFKKDKKDKKNSSK